MIFLNKKDNKKNNQILSRFKYYSSTFYHQTYCIIFSVIVSLLFHLIVIFYFKLSKNEQNQ